MTMLCFARLRYPWQLTEAAAGHYRAFLATNTDRVFARLLKAQDTDSIRALLALDVLDKAAFASAAALAAKAENAAAAALLADAEHKKYAPQPKSSGTILIFNGSALSVKDTPSGCSRCSQPAPSGREPLAVRVSFRFCQRPHHRGGCRRRRLGEFIRDDDAL